jgi:polyphenol oxidase
MKHYFFGNKKQQIFSDPDKNSWDTSSILVTKEPFNAIAQEQGFVNMLFPNQTHGVAGLIVTHADKNMEQDQRSFVQDADWLITNVPTLGIGIITADCVPLLLHDTVTPAVGAVHAGWRGATDGVVIAALDGMINTFGTDPKKLQVFIGPHARTCCYQVDTPFYDIVLQKPWGSTAWHTNNTLFFDLYRCCMEQLSAVGIVQSQLYDTHICTVCDLSYCSYRRDKNHAGRNISCIGLKTHAFTESN